MMERNHVSHAPRNFQPKPNQMYQKKAQTQEPRIPNQLDSINMVEDAIPFCRPCSQFHQESTCYIANQVMEQGLPGISSQHTPSRDPEFMNIVGKDYPLADQHWKHAVDYSLEKDFITQNYGETPTQEKTLKMRNDRFKGGTYQRKEKSTPTKQYKPKVITPFVMNPPIVVKSKLDTEMWLNNVKVSTYAIDILQIPGQKEKLLKALKSNQNKAHDIVKETALPSNNVILEDFPSK